MVVRFRCRGTRKRALLATLLLNANRPIGIERLVDGLWENGRR
jgi:DNA-binding SARP family transcriptional activator